MMKEITSKESIGKTIADVREGEMLVIKFSDDTFTLFEINHGFSPDYDSIITNKKFNLREVDYSTESILLEMKIISINELNKQKETEKKRKAELEKKIRYEEYFLLKKEFNENGE